MATANPLELDIECLYQPTDTEQPIFNILTSYLSHNSSITAQQVAETITVLLPDSQPDDETTDQPSRGGFLCELWDLMFRVAYQLDYQEEPMQRFIMLVKAIRESPVVIMKEGDRFTDGERVWQDLPYFSVMLYGKWTSRFSLLVFSAPPLSLDTDIPGISPDEGVHRKTMNINGLIAHFTNQGIYQGHYCAIAMIHQGLAECNDGRSQNKLQLHLRKLTVAYRVPIAAMYFILCAPKLYKACKQRMCQSSRATGELWKGEPARGYSVARWEFWRSRFVMLLDHPDATEYTRVMQGCD